MSMYVCVHVHVNMCISPHSRHVGVPKCMEQISLLRVIGPAHPVGLVSS